MLDGKLLVILLPIALLIINNIYLWWRFKLLDNFVEKFALAVSEELHNEKCKN